LKRIDRWDHSSWINYFYFPKKSLVWGCRQFRPLAKERETETFGTPPPQNGIHQPDPQFRRQRWDRRITLFAGITNTPVAASVLSLELWGTKIAPYTAIACVISFNHRSPESAHPTQVWAVRKSTSPQVEIGRGMENIRAGFKPRSRSALGAGFRFIKTIQKKRFS